MTEKLKKKSDFWVLQVTTTGTMKVVFDNELTGEEAIEAFNNGDYEDIIDEDHESATAVGFNECKRFTCV